MLANQPLIDFKELNRSVAGEDLERLTFFLAERMHLHPEWTGRGADGGKDLVLTQHFTDPLKASLRWLVSCKDHARSGKAVVEVELPNPFDLKMRQHNAHGFLLVTTTTAAKTTKEVLDSLAEQKSFFTDVWDAARLRKLLLKPENDDLLKQFLPESHARLRVQEGNVSGSIDQLVEAFFLRTRMDAQAMLIPGIADPLPRPERDRIEDQMEACRPVTVSGEAGTGKSGIAYSLCTPRADPAMPVLFIDARKHSGVRQAGDLCSALGLLDPIVASVRRLSGRAGCRVIIDQLDSVSMERSGQVFVDIALECAQIDDVQVAVFSRRRESYEHRMLNQLDAAEFSTVECGELSDEAVRATLERIGITSSSDSLVSLSKNLLNLSLIARIRKQQPEYDFSSPTDETDLWEGYVEVLRTGEERSSQGPVFGEEVIAEATRLATEGLRAEDRTFSLPQIRTQAQRRLESWRVLVPDDAQRSRFYHEKLQDFLYARDAVARELMPAQVTGEISEHRTRNVLTWMSKLYARGNPAKRKQFLEKVFNV